ncbi:MAG: hypothetical protein JNL64_00250 [Blastocatellia bacterium]|nr:hypothetical protein [Blastocatellia bacterium]
MSPKFYGILWAIFATAVLFVLAIGAMTTFAIVAFGFVMFGLVFIGMIGVLPTWAAHEHEHAIEMSHQPNAVKQPKGEKAVVGFARPHHV